MDRFFIHEAINPNIPPFVKNVITAIPRIKSLPFDYDDIETIYIGPRLDYFTAKLAIENILLDEGVEEAKLKNISIKPSRRPYQ